jgi:hypothetical protein
MWSWEREAREQSAKGRRIQLKDNTKGSRRPNPRTSRGTGLPQTVKGKSGKKGERMDNTE